VIIATGIEDSKPKIKNFEIFDGNGAWHCPHCDGFQTINKKLAIITYGIGEILQCLYKEATVYQIKN
jgi:thioredoxin reductase